MAAGRDKTTVGFLRDDVFAAAPAHRTRVESALGGKLKSMDDLARVPPLTLEEAGDPAGLVPRPPLPAGGSRRRQKARTEAEFRTKPVLWLLQSGVPVGATGRDLERLGQMAGKWLSAAGVRDDDLVLSVLPAGPHLPYWQVVLGALALGVPATHQDPASLSLGTGSRLRPTVLAGRPFDVLRLLESDARADAGRALSSVHLVLAVGAPMEEAQRARITALVPRGAIVLGGWAPPGVRAMWWECSHGTGLHTWPDAEVLHVVDPLSGTAVPPGADGEVVWTAVGWHGTVLLRLATGVYATKEDGPCPCGTPGPRLRPTTAAPSFLDALDHHAGVAAWQAELRTCDGMEELVVFLVPRKGVRLEQLLGDLDAELSATQYVVVDRATLDARFGAHDDRQVVDLRA